MKKSNKNCFICGSNLILKKKFYKKNPKENLFGLEKNLKYFRFLYQCENCQHYYNVHNFENYLNKIYFKQYNRITHKDINKKFRKIINLKKKKSSNYYRIKFLKKYLRSNDNILDIGSGIGVFPYMIRKEGYNIDCVESDKFSVNFLEKKINLKVVCNNVMKINKIKKKYSFITLNKVLEHFPLNKVKKILTSLRKIKKKNTLIYTELPSSKAKCKGFKSQEFNFEHYNIFSKKSLKLLIKELNYKILKINEIHEVNNKYTIRSIIR